VTTTEPAVPRPLAESGTIRRLGAEVVEFAVAHDHAIAGLRIRELGLPRDALVNVIVRGDQALPPRGSTRVEAGDRLHVLVRQEAAEDVEDLLVRWRSGPLGRPHRPRLPGTNAPVFSVRPWTDADGDASAPDAINGTPVVERLRTRRDVPGALVALADGTYAVSGPFVATGGARSVELHARRRLSRTPDDDAERAWWQEVIGAVALEGRG
jgi:cell volume regulation protein A